MKRFSKILVVSMAILFILVPVAFAGSGSPENPSGDPPHGLAIQRDAQGVKLVGVIFVEYYGAYRCEPRNCANARIMMRLRKGAQLQPVSGHVEGVLVNNAADLQRAIKEEMAGDILSAFQINGTLNITLKSLDEFVGADDEASPMAQVIGLIQTYVADIEIAVK